MGPSARRGSRAIAGRAHSNGQDGVGSQGLGQLGGAGKKLKREELSTLRINPAFEMLRTQISSCTDSFFEARSVPCIRNIPANSFASSCVSVPHHTCLKRMSKCQISWPRPRLTVSSTRLSMPQCRKRLKLKCQNSWQNRKLRCSSEQTLESAVPQMFEHVIEIPQIVSQDRSRQHAISENADHRSA